MGLADLTPPPNSKLGCAFGRALQTLDADDADVVRGWLESDDWSDNAVAKTLADHVGAQVGIKTVESHRRDECACGRRGWR